jgi:ATP-binding cassette subfamily B protein
MPILARARQGFVHLPRTLRLVTRGSPGLAVGFGVLTLLAAVLPLGVAWIGKAIVDAVVAGDREATLHRVLIELGLVAALTLVQRGLTLVRQLLGARLAVDVNVAILEKAATLELRHFEDSELYDRLTRARREASSRPVSVVTETFSLIQSLITLTGYAGLLWSFSPWAVLGLVVASVPATAVEMRFSEMAFRLRNWRAPENRKLNYIEYVLANDQHAKEVKLFGLGPLLLDRYRTTGERLYREDARLAWRRAAWGYALSLLSTGAFYACYGVMALSAVRGAIGLGSLTLYLVAFRQGQQSFQSILSGIGDMWEHNLYLSNLFGFLDTPVDAPAAPPGAPPVTERGLRFEGVGFRYPGRDGWALRGVDLFVPEGRSLALVGHNGAGKTTFIKLLTRLYEPTEGRILLDGRDLRDWDLDALHRRVAVVFQDFNRYQLPARENVGFGDAPHVDDEPRLDRAADQGGAAEVVAGLPQRWDAMLGRWFKDGTELSGGQWQKIALARAFMREQADILVLDEPTAALDAEAEHAVFERFRALTRGRTSILISHRFPTVRMADHIVVLDAGRVTEQGTHAELVASGGRYAQLFALQAQGYR